MAGLTAQPRTQSTASREAAGASITVSPIFHPDIWHHWRYSCGWLGRPCADQGDRLPRRLEAGARRTRVRWS